MAFITARRGWQTSETTARSRDRPHDAYLHRAVVTQSAVDLSTRSQARRERCPVTRAYPWQLLEHHFALLRDRCAGIKKDEQQHEAAHKGREGHTYQCLPEPHVHMISDLLPNCNQRYYQRNPRYRVTCEEYCCHLNHLVLGRLTRPVAFCAASA